VQGAHFTFCIEFDGITTCGVTVIDSVFGFMNGSHPGLYARLKPPRSTI
jgi:hypothetical protein